MLRGSLGVGRVVGRWERCWALREVLNVYERERDGGC